MSKTLIKSLQELVDAQVISADIADRIRHYYREKEPSSNRLMVVFSILGALLVGLGIILIIAHNWDNLSKTIKLTFALLPLLITQALCAIALWKKSDSKAWRETLAVALMMSVAAAISIVSQVYNIEGSLESFLFTWMLLSIPIVYVMRSMATSLLVIAGLTWYACEVGYFEFASVPAWNYWSLLTAMIPFYIYVVRQPGRNFQALHAWFLAGSLTITLGMFAKSDESWMLVAYISMFSAFIMLYDYLYRKSLPGAFAFLITGSVGQTVMLLVLTFKSNWRNMDPGYGGTLEMQVAAGISLLTAILLVGTLQRRQASQVHPLSFMFVVFAPVFIIGSAYPIVGQVGCNVVVLAIALVTTKRGADQNNLFVLNYGLAIMTILVLCRFFDTDLSFFVRGILFIAVGASFFAANYYAIKKRKSLTV
ncbi:MAG TPA: DUF2157 domain-containing protein [Sphingobacteriaceae bacterium]